MTREETQRMADAWKANDARNRELKAVEAMSLLCKHNVIIEDDIHQLIGENPLPPYSQQLLWKLLEHIEKNYELPDGISITSLYWQFSHDIMRSRANKKCS